MSGLKTVREYQFIKLIGKGSTADVYRVLNTRYDQVMVAKVVTLESMELRLTNLQAAEREIGILCQLDHPGVIRLYDSFTDNNNYYLIFEECKGGTMKDLIMNNTITSETEKIKIIHQILSALNYIHSKKIAHRDIKPTNIFIDYNQKPKLGDFGISMQVEGDDLNGNIIGSAPYVAPEVLLQKKYDSFKADIWSLGIVIYEFLVGKLPWKSTNIIELVDEIKKFQKFNFPNSISPQWRELLDMMLVKDPESRASADVLLSAPIFSNIKGGAPKKLALYTNLSMGNFTPLLSTYNKNIREFKSTLNVNTFLDVSMTKQ